MASDIKHLSYPGEYYKRTCMSARNNDRGRRGEGSAEKEQMREEITTDKETERRNHTGRMVEIILL